MRTLSCLHPQQRTVLISMLDGPFQAASTTVISIPVGNNLTGTVAQAQTSDILKLASGVYKTKFYVGKPLTAGGPADHSAKIQGDYSGHTITVHALNVVLRNLAAAQSGLSLSAMDTGVCLEETATNTLVEDSNVLENSVSAYLHGPKNVMVCGNKTVDDTKLRVVERGNDIIVWNAPGSQMVDDDISQGCNGIFSNTNTNSIYKNSRFSHLRYAVRYMYANDSEVGDNISVGNNVGYALMFSDRSRIYGSTAVGNRDQGIMLSHVNYSDAADNMIYKTDKCAFVHNANYNNLHGDYFEDYNIDVHFAATIEGTRLTDNSFIDNESRVKCVSTRFFD